MELSVIDLIERMKTIQPLKNFESLGYSQNTINNWKFRNSFPKCDDLYKISKCLNVTMEWLLTGEADNQDLPYNEQELLNNYRSLSPDKKAMVDVMIAAIAADK